MTSVWPACITVLCIVPRPVFLDPTKVWPYLLHCISVCHLTDGLSLANETLRSRMWRRRSLHSLNRVLLLVALLGVAHLSTSHRGIRCSIRDSRGHSLSLSLGQVRHRDSGTTCGRRNYEVAASRVTFSFRLGIVSSDSEHFSSRLDSISPFAHIRLTHICI